MFFFTGECEREGEREKEVKGEREGVSLQKKNRPGVCRSLKQI